MVFSCSAYCCIMLAPTAAVAVAMAAPYATACFAAAAKELEKVDWERQPRETQQRYQRPLAIQRINYALRKMGSRLKTKLYA